jgi:hypothetical protein
MSPPFSQLPPFVQDMLSTPPRAGEGVHHWLFRVARQLHAHLPAPEIVNLLESRVANCGRFVPRQEIISAVQNALPCAWQPGSRSQSIHSAPKWPSVNQEQREAVIASGIGLIDLWEISPVRFDDNESHAEEIIDAVFPGDPLLCVGRSESDFATRSREEWRGKLAGLELIVPSPMTARIGRTQEGKESAHTLDSTGPRCFLVIEQDGGANDEQAAVLLHLAERAPLAVAVYSGSKSIHGWFYCTGQPEERLQKFMQYAVSLGADRATWSRSQFVRIPGGTRDNGERQAVYFFNPQVLK